MMLAVAIACLLLGSAVGYGIGRLRAEEAHRRAMLQIARVQLLPSWQQHEDPYQTRMWQ